MTLPRPLLPFCFPNSYLTNVAEHTYWLTNRYQK
jgi:hypothetical protein